jgi:hypothetical protein
MSKTQNKPKKKNKRDKKENPALVTMATIK